MKKNRMPIGLPAFLITLGITVAIAAVMLYFDIFKIIAEVFSLTALTAFGGAVLISVLVGLYSRANGRLTQYEKEIKVLSYRDAMTDNSDNTNYQEHIKNLEIKKLPYGLIIMDLNDFKAVNDRYGHENGDALLNVVIKRLKNNIRENDEAYRIGGDEFMVVIHGTHDKKFYDNVISRMEQNVQREVVLGENRINISIAAGYARCPEDATKYEEVKKLADDAMYNNKRRVKAERLNKEE